MNDKELKVEIIEEGYDEFDYIDMEKLLPSMNLSTEMIPHEEKESIIKDDSLLGLYGEILENCREDRSKADEILSNFLDMIINDGDASSASKEAIVNLLKIKSDTSDKMSKVADLMTRVKLKEKDTFPRYLAAQQNNKVVIEGSKRDLLKSISKITNKKENKNDKKV
jgi:tRNA G10  N-methylase Trm11